MSSRKSGGNKRKIQFREDEDEAEQADVAPSQPAATTSRRDQQREIAQRRAAHFARADPVPLSSKGGAYKPSHTPVSSTPTGYMRRSSLPVAHASAEGEDSEPLEAWPGPFSTARDMIAKRDEAKRLREEAIAAKAAGHSDGTVVMDDESLLDDYDRALKNLVWPIVTSSSSSTSVPSKGFANRGPIPTLTSLCAGLLARHFDQIEGKELSYLQLEERENVATQLAKLRKCDAAAALKLAVEGSQCLVLPECSEVDEETLVKAMEQTAGVAAVRQLEPEENDDDTPAGKAKKTAATKAAKGKKKAAEVEVEQEMTSPPSAAALRVLKLKNVGWGMVDRSAAACINLTQGCLEVLQLTGCYRLNDLALTGLLSANKDALLCLDLSCNSRIGATALKCIRSLSNLQELTLDNCTHLADDALLHLLTDNPSEFTGSGVSASSLATSSAQSSSSSSSASANPLPSLLSLSLTGLIEVTDQSVAPLVRVLGPRLQRLSLSGCVRLTDLSIHSIRQYCGHLHALGLSQLNEVTTAAMVGLFVSHPAVLSGQTGQFSYPSAPSRAVRDSSAISMASATSSSSAPTSSTYSNSAYSNASSNGAQGCEDFEGSDAPPSIGRLEEVCLQGTVCVTDDVVITLCESNRRTLRQLDLSGCHQLTSRAGIALRLHARHSLETLDLSFVRGISQEALGSLVDACAEDGAVLRKLTLWGCTQLNDTFFQSHKKHDLEVVGRMTA